MLKKSWLLTVLLSGIGVTALVVPARKTPTPTPSDEPASAQSEAVADGVAALQCDPATSEVNEIKTGDVWFVGCGGIY